MNLDNPIVFGLFVVTVTYTVGAFTAFVSEDGSHQQTFGLLVILAALVLTLILAFGAIWLIALGGLA